MDIQLWFVLGLASVYCIESECINSANLAQTVSESADRGTSEKTVHEQLTEMRSVQMEILKVLNAMSKSLQSIEDDFMRTISESEARILNEVADKQNVLFNNDGKGNNTDTIGKIVDVKADTQVLDVSGLAETLETIKEIVLDVKRSTTLLTVTSVLKANLPYIPQCETTEQDDTVQSYEDACLQVQLNSMYKDLGGVLQLHVALVGDEAPSKGRVELYYKGKHGSICDYFFRENEAEVVCRMLGYSSGYSQCCGRLGKGEGKMMSGSFRCKGYEESLFACEHGEIDYDEGDCNHDYDIGVICN